MQEQRCGEPSCFEAERKVASASMTHQNPTIRVKGPETDFLPAEDRLVFFWTDFGGIKALKVFFREIRTFCKPLLPRRRKELCCQAVDKKKDRFSVFSDFG